MRDIKVTRPTQIKVDPNFPVSGKAQNITSAGDNTGTPWIEDIINDRSFGWQERILSIAGIEPNGLEENAVQSQISEAIEILIKIVSSGYDAVGSFRWGLVYKSDNDVGIYQGKAYKYVGGDSYPVTVPANTVNPSVASDYEEVEFNLLQNLNGLGQPSDLDKVYERVFSTHSELTSANGLITNTIVHRIGYYNSTDGGGAFYKIYNDLAQVQVEYPFITAADNLGFVITLTDGKVAVNISTVVNYRMFGAKMDDTTVDSDAIYYAHEMANALNLPVQQVGGTALLDNSRVIQIKTPFTAFDFMFSTSVDVGSIIEISPDYPTITIGQGDVTLAEFVKYANAVPSLSAYKQHHAVIRSNETDLVRTGGQVETKKSVTVIGRDGDLVYPLTNTFGSIDSIDLTPINVPLLKIKNLAFKAKGSLPDKMYPIKIKRNNVKLEGVRYIDDNTTQSIPIQQLITIEGAHNVVIDGIVSDSLSAGKIDFNYVVVGYESSKIRINNLVGFDGWAQVDGNWMRDVLVSDSTVDRIGGHFSCWDFTARDIISRGPSPVSISGGGTLHVSNVTTYPTEFATGPSAIVDVRQDYGSEWDGSISVKEVTIDARGLSTGGTFYGVHNYCDSSIPAHDFGRNLKFARAIEVENVTILSNEANANSVNFQGVRLGVAGSTLAGGRTISYPVKISVNDLVYGEYNRSVRNPVNPLYILGSVASTDSQVVHVNIRNCDNSDPREHGLDTFSGGQPEHVLIPDISGVTYECEVSDCNWLRINFDGTGYCSVASSVIAAISGSGRYELDDNKYMASSFSGSWKANVNGGVIRAYFATDSSYKQVGFPNNIEDNWAACKNLRVEVNGAVRSVTQTTSTVQTGFVDPSYYVAP